MAKKADAWKEYREAAMVDMMLEVMPKVAAEVAAPLSKANKITMVADSNGELGAAKLTAEASSHSVSLSQFWRFAPTSNFPRFSLDEST